MFSSGAKKRELIWSLWSLVQTHQQVAGVAMLDGFAAVGSYESIRYVHDRCSLLLVFSDEFHCTMHSTHVLCCVFTLAPMF